MNKQHSSEARKCYLGHKKKAAARMWTREDYRKGKTMRKEIYGKKKAIEGRKYGKGRVNRKEDWGREKTMKRRGL